MTPITLFYPQANRHAPPADSMPLEIDGVHYFTLSEVADSIGVTRQTLWRWRREKHIPPGLKFRGRKVLLSQSEVEIARAYANRVEPINATWDGQLRLFNGIRH